MTMSVTEGFFASWSFQPLPNPSLYPTVPNLSQPSKYDAEGRTSAQLSNVRNKCCTTVICRGYCLLLCSNAIVDPSALCCAHHLQVMTMRHIRPLKVFGHNNVNVSTELTLSFSSCCLHLRTAADGAFQ